MQTITKQDQKRKDERGEKNRRDARKSRSNKKTTNIEGEKEHRLEAPILRGKEGKKVITPVRPA